MVIGLCRTWWSRCDCKLGKAQTESCHEFCLLQHLSCFSPRHCLQLIVEIEMSDLRPAYAGSFCSTDWKHSFSRAILMKHCTQQTQPSVSALFLCTEHLGTCCYLFKISINPGKYEQLSKAVGRLLILINISHVSGIFFCFNQRTFTNCS